MLSNTAPSINTSLSEKPPWETYDSELDPMRDASPDLVKEVEEYSKRRHTVTGSQTVEEYHRIKEENDEAVEKFKFDCQDELLDEKVRVGRIMHHAEFLRRLRTILPARYNDWSERGLVGLSVYTPSESGGEWKYVCAVQVGFAPEYSMLHFDDHGLPLNEKYRGWRTVVLRLILGGHITEEQADKAFGPPAIGPVSSRYRRQLYAFRNR